ncbi:ComEC/Rec2 family competence protein [Pseudoroseicyclus aestuarii]|nr:ComEC/Rec2 family competence protein [Pseudoroseicyclus aestuarii]
MPRLRVPEAGWLRDALAAQRGHLMLWVPVLLGLGIGIYFSLPVEPAAPQLWALAALALLGLAAALRWPRLAPLPLGAGLVAAGLVLGALRAQSVAAPVLGWRYYGPVEGRVVKVDRSASDAVRLTLDRVRLEDVVPARTPARIRLSLHGPPGGPHPEPGLRVMTTGHLSPPSGPVEPGGFDFRRYAWFQRLGAVGYTRAPVLLAADEAAREGLGLHRLRAHLSAAVRSRIGGDAGGFAAAVTTGDRSGLSRGATEALRDANLFHLVSISGMHMGMLAGFVFAALRGGLALIPPLALRLPAKKIAAGLALAAAGFYLALAGRAVATERAFVMVAVMLGAVLLDRRAISLRALATAALIVLALRPETLLSAGFQMSFAAVVALIAVFSVLPYRLIQGRWAFLAPVLGLALSSVVAGMATAPFAAAHFNRVAHYGLLANLLAVPAMASLVMPGAVLAALLSPLGLAAPALGLMALGSGWILWVAQAIAGLGGATSAVATPPPPVLPLIVASGLFLALWRGHLRASGLLPLALAAGLWLRAERPALLIAESGALIGLMTPEGRALSKPGGDGYAAGAWLLHDGSTLAQEEAHRALALPRDGKIARAQLGEALVMQVSGKTALAGIDGCGGADLLVLDQRDDAPRPCRVLDAGRLRRTGAVAVSARDGMMVIETSAERAGQRPWTTG